MHISLIDTDSRWAWGIRMISAVLKRGGYRSTMFMMSKQGDSYSEAELAQLESQIFESDVIGISCCSAGFMRARAILEHLRGTGKLLIWGGIHATLNPEECSKYADVVCVGEGEGMILDLVKRLEGSQSWHDIKNAAFTGESGFTVNPIRPLIGNMDELPLLDFSCEDEFHLIKGRLVRNSSPTEFAHEEIPFVGSRGCVFHCTYCCNGRLQQIFCGAGKYVRKHSIAECVSRPAALKAYFPDSKYIFFVDDDFLDRSIPELEQFAREYPAKVALPFECQVSPLRVTRERVDLLRRAGVWRIRMGVESGSERTKKELYRRSMPNTAVERASEILAQYPEIIRAYYLIMGNPFEERSDLLETIELLHRLPSPYFVQIFNLIFFPGSELFDRAVAEGLIDGAHDSGYNLHYRGGYRYDSHSWKRKNLYLNTLLFMMDGKITRYRLGHVPRFLLPFLVHPKVIDFAERIPSLARTMINMKLLFVNIRTFVGRAIKRFVRDPALVYNPIGFAKGRFRKIVGSASI